MDEQNYNDQSGVKDEFKNLGDNLKNLLSSMWESEERRKFQAEIEEGLHEIGKALDDLAVEIKSSEAGQTLKKEVKQFGEQVQSGEFENKAREEILKTLKFLNQELQKAVDNFSSSEDSSEEA